MDIEYGMIMIVKGLLLHRGKVERQDIMKFGIRTPSISKSIKARTTGRVKRAVKSAVNPFYGKSGMGLVNDPSRAIYNFAYKRTTIGVLDILESKKARENSSFNNVFSKSKLNIYEKVEVEEVMNASIDQLEALRKIILESEDFHLHIVALNEFIELGKFIAECNYKIGAYRNGEIEDNINVMINDYDGMINLGIDKVFAKYGKEYNALRQLQPKLKRVYAFRDEIIKDIDKLNENNAQHLYDKYQEFVDDLALPNDQIELLDIEGLKNQATFKSNLQPLIFEPSKLSK